MSRATIQIELSDEFRALAARYESSALAPAISEAIRRGLDDANGIAVSRIKSERMTGNGPFPPSQHRLGHRSRTLLQRFDSNRATIDDAQRMKVSSAMGAKLKYYGAHEFGFSGPVQVEAHKRTGPSGTKHKVKAHRRQMKIPERRPARAELAEQRTKDIYDQYIGDSVEETLTGT